MGSNQSQISDSEIGDRDDRYIHLKDVFVNFINRRPTADLELVFEKDCGVVYQSDQFKKDDLVHWNIDTYVKTHSWATLTIQTTTRIQQDLFKISVAQIDIEFKPNKFGDWSIMGLQDTDHHITVSLVCGRPQSLEDVARVLGFQAYADLASTAPSIQKLPRLAVLPPTTSERGYNAPYPAIYWLNNDILLGVFDYYRLDEYNDWNVGLGWCKLSHVCQRWRHLIYKCAFHLGIQIRCTNGTPIVDMLDQLPPVPLVVDYAPIRKSVTLTEQDELGLYHALRLHDRVRHVEVFLPPSILHKVVMLLDEQFPILEHLSVMFLTTSSKNSLPLTLPKAFLAPNLRHLALPGFSPPRRLRVLTSTVSLVRLELIEIQTSSYFRPRLLVARLQSLPQLQELYIGFSIPIPRPSNERELLGEHGAPATLHSLKTLEFKGVGTYLESLVAQIWAPLLERLEITLFNQIVFAFPHLFHLIYTIEGFRFLRAEVYFDHEKVFVTAYDPRLRSWPQDKFYLSVLCKPLDWQIDCASQICHALIPALSGVEQLRLICSNVMFPTEWQNLEIDGTTWHDLLRSFVGVKELFIHETFLVDLSRALQMDEVGSDPGFLPNLRSIHARRNLFNSFIHTRYVVGRLVRFVRE